MPPTVQRVSRFCFLPFVAAFGAWCGACAEPYPSVDCRQVVWSKPLDGAHNVRVVGSWDGWATPGTEVVHARDGWLAAVLRLPPGDYGYQIIDNGKPRLDRYEPLTTFRGEQEVSLLNAPDCTRPELHIDDAKADALGTLSLAGTFLASQGGAPLDAARIEVTIDGAMAAGARVQAVPEAGTFTVAAEGLEVGKHAISVTVGDVDRMTANASVWVKPAADTWDDAVLYQVVTDRFRGDGGVPLAAPATPGARAGGTLGGISAEIERGTFEALGVSALWISPVYTNPSEAREGRGGHMSEGYHGYWPLEVRQVEPRIGGEAALDTLLAVAHAHGIRVLFDLVPNHVYEKSARYLAHRQDGWFSDKKQACVCGEPGCDWSTHIIDCWFTPYLPDVRWQDAAAMTMAVEDTLFWMGRFDADGVRIDAVPMMNRAATRRIVNGLRRSMAPARALFAIGEVFTGGGEAGTDQIKYFMGPNGLDSAFDFPLMWAMREAIGSKRAGFDAIESTLAYAERALQGSGSMLARILDNHDTSRFLSDANGDGAQDPWSSPPPQPSSPEVYARHRMALALIFALPGMPVIYNGDEVALAGASDPDSRRVMPALEALLPEQQKTLELTRRLGTLRRCMKALRTGERVLAWVDARRYAFARDAGDGAPALALFSTAPGPVTIPVPGGIVPPGSYVDTLSGEPIMLVGGDAIPIDPLTVRLFIPSSSPCRPYMP